MRDDQLARILADPDNDQLRLEIAEELGPGSVRAEFMRLQIERQTGDRLAKRPRRSDESAREEARERHLAATHQLQAGGTASH